MEHRIAWPSQTVAWVQQNDRELLIGLAVALTLVAIMLVMRRIGEKIVVTDPNCQTWKSVLGRVLEKTSFLFMVVAALDVVANYTAPPERILELVDDVFIVVAAFQAAIWARELVMGIIGQRVGDEPGETTLGNARSVIRVLLTVGLFALAIIVILDNLGVNVTALVAGLGIGGIAIGLAAQGIFADLFAALSILLDKPFRRGDTISYGTSVGTVERIGLKTTRIRSLTGEQLVMANTKLLEQEIRNLAEGMSRRTTVPFGVTYQTALDKLRRIPIIAQKAVEAQPGCSFVRCTMIAFGPSSLDHELLYDVASLDPNTIAADRAAILMTIIRAFTRQEIDFAYPTQTTFTAAPDGTMIMPFAGTPAPSPDPAAAKGAK